MSAKQNSPQNTSRNICVDNTQPMTNSTAEKSSFWPQSKSIVIHTVWKLPKNVTLEYFANFYFLVVCLTGSDENSENCFVRRTFVFSVKTRHFFRFSNTVTFLNIIHTVWKSPKMSHWNFLSILNFLVSCSMLKDEKSEKSFCQTNFCF